MPLIYKYVSIFIITIALCTTTITTFAEPINSSYQSKIVKMQVSSCTQYSPNFIFKNNFSDEQIGSYVGMNGFGLTTENWGISTNLKDYTVFDRAVSQTFSDRYTDSKGIASGQLYLINKNNAMNLVSLCGFSRGCYCARPGLCTTWFGIYAQSFRCDFGDGDGTREHPLVILLNAEPNKAK